MKYRGVAYHEPSGKYAGYVIHNSVRVYAGYYDTAQDAARERDLLAREIHGEFALLALSDENLKITEACERYGISRYLVNRWIKTGAVSAGKVGMLWSINRESLEDCMYCYLLERKAKEMGVSMESLDAATSEADMQDLWKNGLLSPFGQG